MTPQQFAIIGRALYGPSWRGELAGALKVADRTIRRWERGESDIPAGISGDMSTLCRTQSKTLVSLADALERSQG